jgi:heme/copper-type cytochrome/quinol oxidase subunit 3
MTAGAHPVRAERGRIARANGWWGMAVFVASEATLFGTIFGTYFYLRFRNAQWPPDGIPDPEVVVPVILTAVLVATSLPVQLAFSRARAGRVSAARWLLALALVVQAGYFAMQMNLFLDDLGKFGPGESAYGSIYFTMLGAHHAHVVLGMLLELFLFLRLLRGLTNYRLIGLQTTAFYWHFVNVLGLCVLGAQLYAAL